MEEKKRSKEKPEEKKRNFHHVLIHQAVKGVESSRVERMPSEMTIEVKSAAAVALPARVFDSNILYSRAHAFHGSQ